MSIIRQEIRSAFIVDCTDSFIWVVPKQSCKSGEGCHVGCGGCGGKKPAHRKKVFLKHPQTCKAGQKITYSQYILNENIAALLVFGIPVFMALLTSLLWFIFEPQKIESLYSLLTAGLAFVAGFPVVSIIDALFRKSFPTTVIELFTPNSEDRQLQEF